MADDTKLWAKIQADFRLGVTMNQLRKKYRQSVAAILKRAKAEGWSRAKDMPATINGRAMAVIVPPSEAKTSQARKVDELVDEAVGTIMREHRRITRGLRDLFEENVAEFQAMLSHFNTFMDEERIAELKASGKPSELVDYLQGAMAAFTKRTALMDRLIAIGGSVISQERIVWGLKDYEGEETADWDELVEKLKEPIEIPVLPSSVLNFDKRAH